MDSGLDKPDNTQPRYRPWFDPVSRVWVGRKVEELEAEERQARYIEAIKELLKAQAILERALTNATHTELRSPQVQKALWDVDTWSTAARENYDNP
jgi:hypothetical protein